MSPEDAILGDMKQRPPTSSLEEMAAHYIEARRGRRVRGTAPRAGVAAGKILRPLARKFGVGIEQLRANWADIVGSRLAQWSEPETVQRQGASRTLVIRARGPAAAVLQAESRRVLDRVRTYTGAQGPTRIRVIQGAGRKQNTTAPQMNKQQVSSQVSEGVEQTAEARLLSALKRFDRSVKSRGGL